MVFVKKLLDSPYKDIYGISLLFPHIRAAKIGEKSYYGLSISTLKFHLLKQTLCTSGIWGRVCLIQDNVVNLILSIIHTWQYFALNLRSIPSWAQFLEIGVIINATLFCKIHLKALIWKYHNMKLLRHALMLKK